MPTPKDIASIDTCLRDAYRRLERAEEQCDLDAVRDLLREDGEINVLLERRFELAAQER